MKHQYVILVTFILVLAQTITEIDASKFTASHITQFPFEVSIRQRFCDICSYEHHCSGVIYSKSIILTTASCVKTATIKRTHIVAGTSKSFSAAQDGQVYLIDKITLHADETIDLALIHLAMDLDLNEVTISAVSLATEVPKAGAKALLAGWGQISEFEKNFQEYLKLIQVPIMDLQLCREAYFWTQVRDTELCAGYEQGGADACEGDAGSPLMVNGQLVGLASWGYGCARAGNPGVYTNVVALRKWIEDNA